MTDHATNPLTADALAAAGFRGFIRFTELRNGALTRVPHTEGAYVVLRATPDAPVFVAESCGGHFKGKNPTVTIERLAAKWVDGVQVVYIGKAKNLQERLKQYADYGSGKAVGHQGGRYIWQLADADDLLVAWTPCTNPQTPAALEAELISTFKKLHQRLPFANIADPSAQLSDKGGR